MVVPGSPGCDAMLSEGAPEVHGGACVVEALARVWSSHRALVAPARHPSPRSSNG
jgi:hypothetical protein